MGSLLLVLPYFSHHLFLLLLFHFTSKSFSLCNPHDSSALLQFKNSFFVNTSSKPASSYTLDPSCSSFSFKTESWKNNTDCCKWDGVTCDNVSNHVIGLDISCNNLQGELHPNSTLFKFRHLQQLNLAFNYFSISLLPVSIGDLVSLTHLNLSHCGLTGNIPSQISHLSKLVSLDLSRNSHMELNPFTWKKFIHNASNLGELYLDYVNMYSIKESSLSMLKNLSSSLVSFSLRGTRLQGYLSSDILTLPYLQTLDLSFNKYLSAQLPKSNWSNPLRYLDLSFSNFSGEIPYSLGQLTSLTHLNLARNNFEGEIPSLLSKLTNLISLDLGYNKLSGNIPNVFENLIKLEYLDLSRNKLVGPIPNEITNQSKLSVLSLGHNILNGTIPHWCYYLPSLLRLDLSDNHLTEFIGNFSTHSLEYLFLSSNNLHGHFPNSIFKLQNLTYLDLSSTNLSGVVHFHQFLTFKNLYFLNLSHNTINIDGKAKTLPPSSLELHLGDNHLTGFIGNFSTHSLEYLILSNNNLHGPFPNSIFELQNLTYLDLSSTNLSGVVHFHQFLTLKNLYFLNLSHNSALSINIDGKAKTLPPHFQYLSSTNSNRFPNLRVLDLSNNNIHGRISKWFQKKLLNSWKNIQHIDLSFNKLQGDLPIPPYGIRYLLLSNNNFTGDIAMSFCNASSLQVLNLAHNNLTGKIPECLGTFTFLSILDMQMNNFYGSIPRTFCKQNNFETIKLNDNQLEGPLPRSLAHCTSLEILDLGDNNIDDAFPNWLETLQELQVLRLRSNKLHGKITCSSTEYSFPMLTIFDISHNNLSGPLPTSCIKNFQGMINVNDNQIGPQYIGRVIYYIDSVVVVMKGFSMELTRILTTFTTIDLSNNMFEGEIPYEIGELISLIGLNLSNNEITGNIPQSLSNLRNLEWLDLSKNQLIGEIPTTLTSLTFLSILNLSENHLEGTIPTGKQFNTFGNSSYDGNAMLCGFPLSKSCVNEEDQPPISTSKDEEEESGFGWKAVATGYVCGAIFGLLFGYNVFFLGKLQWLLRFFERMFNVRLKRTHKRVGGNRS